jgi:hypothetical protein
MGVHCQNSLGWGFSVIGLSQEKDRWWTVVNAVMNIRVL